MKTGIITNYSELEAFGKKHYNEGGDVFVECWDQSTLDYYAAEGSPLTWEDVYSICSIQQEEQRAAEYFAEG